MSEFWGTLLAVIVGAVAAAGGTMVIEWWKYNRDKRDRDTELLRVNLYALQDGLADMFRAVQETIEFRTNAGPPAPSGNVEFNSKGLYLRSLVVRIGDLPIAQRLPSFFELLNQARWESDYTAAMDLVVKAESVTNYIQNRIDLLFRGSIQVDYGRTADDLNSDGLKPDSTNAPKSD